MKIILLSLIILIINGNNLFPQRIMIGYGFDTIEVRYKDKNKNDVIVDQCDYKTSCSVRKTIQPANRNPIIVLETSPIYFGNTNFGTTFGIHPYTTVKTKLLNFPRDNESMNIKSTSGGVYSELYYLWGDPELGKKKEWAIRFGLNINYYDKKYELDYNNKNYKINHKDWGLGGLISLDWNKFSS